MSTTDIGVDSTKVGAGESVDTNEDLSKPFRILLVAMKHDVHVLKRNIRNIDKIQEENRRKMKNLQYDIQQMLNILGPANSVKGKQTVQNALGCPQNGNESKSSQPAVVLAETPKNVVRTRNSIVVKGQASRTVHTRSANTCPSKSDVSLVSEGKLKTKTGLSNSQVLSIPKEDTESKTIQAAVQNAKGLLSPEKLILFLHLAQSVDDPVKLAKESFTTKTALLHLQLWSLKYHLRSAHRPPLKSRPADSENSPDRRLEQRVGVILQKFSAQCLKKIHRMSEYDNQNLVCSGAK